MKRGARGITKLILCQENEQSQTIISQRPGTVKNTHFVDDLALGDLLGEQDHGGLGARGVHMCVWTCFICFQSTRSTNGNLESHRNDL